MLAIIRIICVFILGTACAFADEQLNEDLFSAIIKKDVSHIEALIDKGADVNAKTKFGGFTTLMLASTPEIFALLIKRGARVDEEHAKGGTGLQHEAFMGTEQGVERYVKAGADVNRADSRGVTPVMFACLSGKFDSVLYLLSSGANANIKLENGNSALFMCIMSASKIPKKEYGDEGKIVPASGYAAKMAVALDAIKSILERGADLHTPTYNIEDKSKTITPYEAAVRLGREEVIELLNTYASSGPKK